MRDARESVYHLDDREREPITPARIMLKLGHDHFLAAAEFETLMSQAILARGGDPRRVKFKLAGQAGHGSSGRYSFSGDSNQVREIAAFQDVFHYDDELLQELNQMFSRRTFGDLRNSIYALIEARMPLYEQARAKLVADEFFSR